MHYIWNAKLKSGFKLIIFIKITIYEITNITEIILVNFFYIKINRNKSFFFIVIITFAY